MEKNSLMKELTEDALQNLEVENFALKMKTKQKI